jgi:ferrous iron transport protein B
MSAAQILTFTIFVTFYVPCLATLAAMTKEIGSRLTALSAAYSVALATVLAVASRLLFRFIHIH